MPKAIPLLLALATTALASAVPAQTIAPNRPPRLVALVDAVKYTTGIARNLHEREVFLASFERSLAESGWTTIQATGTPVCSASTDCLPNVGKLASTKHVLRLTGEGNAKYGYNMEVELYSGATAQTQKVGAYCDICNAERMGATVARFALQLLATAANQDEAPKHQHTGPAPAAAPLAPKVQPARDIVSTPNIPHLHNHISWIPWSMIGVGALGIAYGGYALHENGECSQTSRQPVFTCDRISSRTLGLAALASGGVLFIGGGIWKLISTLSFSSNHIALNVRF